ncbi:MAG: hypothetical protein EOP84_12855 [Verrucomicrobiaceae bacterium]|nr:MAG: hypothetical protein EOP84_12855 [Verrucomicrobiaceae bacterium]
MEAREPTVAKLGRQYVGGVFAGTGVGLVFATVIYKYFPGAETRDWLTIIAFPLLVLGSLYARKAQRRETPESRMHEK